MNLSFTVAAGPPSAIILRAEFRGTHDHILLSQIRDSPQPKVPGPRIYIPRNRVARLYLKAQQRVYVLKYAL
jgi:hypothetical protein